MILSRFLQKIDDWLNPIVVKELRQAVQSRMAATALILVLSVQVGYVAIYLMQAGMEEVASGASYSDGRNVFGVVQAILLGGCLLLLPAYAGSRLSAERSDTNVDLLFITTLRPGTIVSGKLFATVLLVMILFSATAPFMMFSYLLRGVDVPTMLLILGIDFLAVIGGVQLALFLSSIPAARPIRGAMGLLGFIGLIYLFVGAYFATMALIEGGTLFGMLGSDAAWIAASILAGFLTHVGFLYVWSVALLSPPSSNRALVVRLYTTAAWLVAGGVAMAWARYATDFAPLFAWLGISAGLVALYLLIAICEREKWGPRVARTIPRSMLLRPLAFLFYSGAAGGIGFAAMLWLLTFAICAAHFSAFEHDWRNAADLRDVVVGINWLYFAYAYCYAMSALLLRKQFLSKTSFKQENTWVLAMLLGLLGSVGPLMIAHAVEADGVRMGRPGWWYLASPPMAIEEVTTYSYVQSMPSPPAGAPGYSYYGRGAHQAAREEFVEQVYWFTTIWAGLVTLLALPWAVRQYRAFRRPALPGSVPADEAVPLAEVIDEPKFVDPIDSDGIQTARRDE